MLIIVLAFMLLVGCLYTEAPGYSARFINTPLWKKICITIAEVSLAVGLVLCTVIALVSVYVANQVGAYGDSYTSGVIDFLRYFSPIDILLPIGLGLTLYMVVSIVKMVTAIKEIVRELALSK